MRPVFRLRDRGSAPRIDRDLLVRRMFPAARALIQLGWFSFDVEGLEHVPREGPVVFAQNHAGWFALDAFFVTFAVAQGHGLRRAPYFATHDAALAAPVLGPFLRRFGALPASWFRRPERLPPEVESIGFCPEGVVGNTKPFWQAYRMKDWNRGFVRVAIARDAPIVPVAVLGSEECLPVAFTVKALEPLVGSIFGAPLAPIPLPARWRVVFHPPVHVAAHGREAIADSAFCSAVARQVQGIVQETLDVRAAGYPLGRLAAWVEERRARRAAAEERAVDPLAPAPEGAAPHGSGGGPEQGPRQGPRSAA